MFFMSFIIPPKKLKLKNFLKFTKKVYLINNFININKKTSYRFHDSLFFEFKLNDSNYTLFKLFRILKRVFVRLNHLLTKMPHTTVTI